MIRVDACAWPREYDRRFLNRLPSPYTVQSHYICVGELDRIYPERQRKRLKTIDIRKVYFEVFENAYRSACGMIYYFKDWRQLNYTAPEYRQNRS